MSAAKIRSAEAAEKAHREDLRERLRIPLITLRQRTELAQVLGSGQEPEMAAEALLLLRRDLDATLALLGVDVPFTRARHGRRSARPTAATAKAVAA